MNPKLVEKAIAGETIESHELSLLEIATLRDHGESLLLKAVEDGDLETYLDHSETAFRLRVELQKRIKIF